MFDKKIKKIKIKFIKCFNQFIEKYLNYLAFIFLIIIFAIYVLSIKFSFFQKLEITIYSFINLELFIESRISTLTTISVVLIGFYITVMSIFGTSYSKAIVKISRNDLGNKFMNYANISIFITFIYFLLTIFFDIFNNKLFLYFYSSIFIYTITNFIRFSSIVLKMYKVNITKASNIIDKELKEKKDLMRILKEIRDLNFEEKSKSSGEEFKNIKEKTKAEKGNAPEIPEK